MGHKFDGYTMLRFIKAPGKVPEIFYGQLRFGTTTSTTGVQVCSFSNPMDIQNSNMTAYRLFFHGAPQLMSLISDNSPLESLCQSVHASVFWSRSSQKISIYIYIVYIYIVYIYIYIKTVDMQNDVKCICA